MNCQNKPKYVPLKPFQGLSADTVSFSGSHTIQDTVEHIYLANADRYKKYAEEFFEALRNTVKELSDYGYSFDEEYAMRNPVKSVKSMSSKIIRSGSFDVPDIIRTTVFNKNLYDLELVNNRFLPLMEKNGFLLAKQNGKLDIDYRLEGIGKPQPSGYEDIQMRFIKKNGGKNKVKHELITLFGPNYAKAKHEESEKVYGILRQFKELHMDCTENVEIGSHAFKANRYINLISDMITSKISKKLYSNAKNKDYYGIDDVAKVHFTDENKSLLTNYFNGLNDNVKDYYKEKFDTAKSSMIAKIQLKKDKSDDIALINYIRNMLNETIKYFEVNQ